MTSSPTSTLLGMSHMSPPLSPMSPYGESNSQFSSGLDQMHACAGGMRSYKDVLSELMTSLEAMKFNNIEPTSSSPFSSPINSSAAAAAAAASYRNNPWVDVSSFNAATEDQQQQFILSPSTPNPLSAGVNCFSPGSTSSGNCSRKSLVFDEQDNKVNDTNGGGCSPDPDLGWVNDLLM